MIENPPSNPTTGPADPSGTHIDEDRCIDLLHGLLPPEETERILTHMADCAPCEALFRDRVGERARLRAAFEIRHASGGEPFMAPVREEDEGPDAGRPSSLHGRFAAWIESLRGGGRAPAPRFFGWAAATGLAVIAALWIGLGPDRQPSDMTWMPPYMEESSLRSSGDAFWMGLEAYQQRKLDACIDLLRAADVPDSIEHVRRIYLASALGMSGRDVEAAELLAALPEATIQAIPQPVRSVVLWTQVTVYRRTGRAADADSLLRLLAAEPNESGRRARDLLR